MKKLIALSLLLLFFSIGSASYDFDLKADGLYHMGLDNKLVIDNIKVRNGLLDYSVRYEHPIGPSKNYAGASVYSMNGEYLPKEKILEGQLEYTVSLSKEQYSTTRCGFYSTELVAETEKVTLFFKNCIEYKVRPWEGGNEEMKTGLSPLTFKIQNSNLEETKTKLEDSGTRFSDISGSVEILFPTGYEDDGTPIFEDEENWQFAKLGMELPYGAKIKLKEKSAMILSFPSSEPYEMRTPENLYPYDETIIILPLKPQKENQFKLLGGQLYNNFKKMLKDGSMDIEMSQAVAGIKGTTFILEEDGKISTIKVIDGEVDFTSKATSQKETIIPGETITATNTGLSVKQTFNVNEELKKWPENNFPALPLIIVMVVVGISLGFYILRKKTKR